MNVLPTEILAKILDYLPKDISTLANFGAVCREFYTFSSHDNYWRQCWRRKYHDIEPQQNFKYVLSELHKFKKTNSLIMEGIQVLMVGATGVGKSSISIQQFENIFVEYIDPTFQQVIVRDQYTTLHVVQGSTSKTNSLYNFPPKEYYSLGGYVLVFSLVDQSSFTVLDDFIQQIYKCKGDRTPKDTIPIVLVGNKHDLLAMHKPRVSNGEILEFMNKYNLEYYFEASAKKNYNINDLFRCVSELVVDHSALRFKDQITKFQEGPPKEKKCTVM